MFAQVSCANKFISAIGAGIERGVHCDEERGDRRSSEAEDELINV